MSEETQWSPESMLEVSLKEPDDFLKVRETLTRIGVASRKDKKLFQSCHILHKQGRYWGLISIINPDNATAKAPLSQIKVISFKDKNNWTLETKYNIGKKIDETS